MTLPAAYRDAVCFSFGDSEELADDLLARVLSGKKTATCGGLHEYAKDEPLPVVGRCDVVLDGCGKPACVIETVEVRQCRFDDVGVDFAVAEGEGDYDDWRAGHIAYFNRNGGWSGDMILVCERFRLVEVLS